MPALLARFDQIEDKEHFYVPIKVEYQDGEFWASTPLLHRIDFSGATLEEALQRIESEVRHFLRLCLEEGYDTAHNVVLTAWLKIGREELDGSG